MITREEYSELKKLYNDGYRWIARDSFESIYAYKLEPIKLGFSWEYSKNNMATTCGDDFLLPYIYVKWEDVKPTSIVDLIRDYESHQEIVGENNLNKAELIKEIEEILDDIGVSDYQLGECDCLRNHEDASDILDKAWLDGFIVSEDEPLYYALIKGHELSSNEFKYWSCNAYNSGDLFIGSKRPKDSCINRMTKNNWNKLGISSSNADFVVE